MSRCHIAKSTASGTVCAPPSKSYAHRLLLAAFLSAKPTRIGNIDLSDDISATIGCIEALGASVSISGREATVAHLSAGECRPLECRESGSTLRFMIPVALAKCGKGYFTGSTKLFSRGIGEYRKLFDKQRICFSQSGNSLTVEGELKSGTFTIDGATSSQYITGLLFASPLLQGDSTIVVTPPVQSRPYIDITLDVLRMAGIEARFDNNEISVPGNQTYRLPDCSVEGDWSNAAFLDIYNHLGGKVTVTGLNPQSLQGDRVYRELFRKLDDGYCTIDIGNCIDLGPVLFCLAAVKHGARFVNTARLRIKESDRVSDILCELKKIGVNATAEDNSVDIKPISEAGLAALECKSVVFSAHNDHRLAMSLAALASIFGATIEGSEAVSKSYPGFWEDVKHLNIDICNG